MLQRLPQTVEETLLVMEGNLLLQKVYVGVLQQILILLILKPIMEQEQELT